MTAERLGVWGLDLLRVNRALAELGLERGAGINSAWLTLAALFGHGWERRAAKPGGPLLDQLTLRSELLLTRETLLVMGAGRQLEVGTIAVPALAKAGPDPALRELIARAASHLPHGNPQRLRDYARVGAHILAWELSSVNPGRLAGWADIQRYCELEAQPDRAAGKQSIFANLQELRLRLAADRHRRRERLVLAAVAGRPGGRQTSFAALTDLLLPREASQPVPAFGPLPHVAGRLAALELVLALLARRGWLTVDPAAIWLTPAGLAAATALPADLTREMLGWTGAGPRPGTAGAGRRTRAIWAGWCLARQGAAGPAGVEDLLSRAYLLTGPLAADRRRIRRTWQDWQQAQAEGRLVLSASTRPDEATEAETTPKEAP